MSFFGGRPPLAARLPGTGFSESLSRRLYVATSIQERKGAFERTDGRTGSSRQIIFNGLMFYCPT